jgi:hypothetical protein
VGQTIREIRLGRNFLRVGDTCKVKLPGKTRFTSGWTVKEITVDDLVRVARDGHWRVVRLDAIRRVAQTKNGQARNRQRGESDG